MWLLKTSKLSVHGYIGKFILPTILNVGRLRRLSAGKLIFSTFLDQPTFPNLSGDVECVEGLLNTLRGILDYMYQVNNSLPFPSSSCTPLV